jgi:hypothetical protein
MGRIRFPHDFGLLKSKWLRCRYCHEMRMDLDLRRECAVRVGAEKKEKP